MSDAAALKDEANKAFAAENYLKATELYYEAIELDTSNHVLYSNRSASKAGQKDYTGALEDAEKVRRCRERPLEVDKEEDEEEKKAKTAAEELKAKGNTSYKARRFEKAIELYQRAWDLYPKEVTFLTNLSAVYLEKGEYERAIETAEKAVEEGRHLRADGKIIGKAFGRIGSAHAKLGDLTNAIKFYGKSLTEHPTPDIVGKLRDAAKKAEAERQAYIHPENAEASVVGHPHARQAAAFNAEANKALAAKNYPKATELYSKAIGLDPSNHVLYSNRSASKVWQQDYAGALEDAETRSHVRTIGLDPSFSKGHGRKGVALLGLRRYPDAVRAYEAGLQVDPNSNIFKEGLAEAKKAMDAKPGNPMDQIIRLFTDPALFAKLEADPETRDYLKDPGLVQKIRQLQTGAGMRLEMLADPRMVTVLGVAIGTDIIRNIAIRVELAKSCSEKAHQAFRLGDRNTAEGHLLAAGSVLADVANQTHHISGRDLEDYLTVCAVSDYWRFQISGKKRFIDGAVSAHKRAISVSETPFFHEFGAAQALISRYWVFCDPADIEAATKYARDALRHLPPGNATLKGEFRRIEGQALVSLFEECRTVDVLKDGITALEEATSLAPRKSVSLGLAYKDLGDAYLSLQVCEDSRTSLNKAGNAFRTAHDILREQSPGQDSSNPDLAACSHGLGRAMLDRYRAFHIRDDLRSAVTYLRRSCENVDHTDTHFATLISTYCSARRLQYELEPQTDILIEADVQLERALNTPLALPANTISRLKTVRGLLSQELFKATNGEEDLDKAIAHFKSALDLEGLSRERQVVTQVCLGDSLGKKARITRQREGFDAAFKALEDAKALVPGDDPLFWRIPYSQTRLLYEVHDDIPEWVDSFGWQALASCLKLADTVSMPTNARLIYSAAAASLAYHFGQASEAARYQADALQLLPEMLSGATTRAELLRQVRKYFPIPSTAAALSLAAGDSVSTAIQRLESGRSFLWDRLLVQTTPIEDLQRENPDLAAEFEVARSALRRQTDMAAWTLAAPTARNGIMQRDVFRLEREVIWKRYEDALNKIREQPGFENFLRLGPMPADLQQHAAEAPIVYVNVSRYRSDALIVTQDKVYAVPLPMFSVASIAVRFAELLWAREALLKREQQEQALAKFDEIMGWLWDAVAEPVLDSIDFARYKPGRTGKPRVIWVRTQSMSLFPIHAAGKYLGNIKPKQLSCIYDTVVPTYASSIKALRYARKAMTLWMRLFPVHAAGKNWRNATPEQPSCVHDMVVSTYTTSIKALRYARERSALLQANQSAPSRQKMLLVAMQFTPGEPELPKAVEEAQTIASRVKVHGVTSMILPHPDVRAAREKLQQCDLAFFACHSEADEKDPSKRAILLGSPGCSTAQRLTVHTILNARVDACRLVYLSSCESGSTLDLKSSDEGLSIAGAFHLKGAPHAVSGMWQVDDTVAFRVVTVFFEGLVVECEDGDGIGGHLDVERAADALHVSIQRLRDDGVPSMMWAPFIHSGC